MGASRKRPLPSLTAKTRSSTGRSPRGAPRSKRRERTSVAAGTGSPPAWATVRPSSATGATRRTVTRVAGSPAGRTTVSSPGAQPSARAETR